MDESPANLVGSYVGKSGVKMRGGGKLILGKVTACEDREGVKTFVVAYEDGLSEQLDHGELGKILISADDKRASYYKKRKLDQVLSSPGSTISAKRRNTRSARSKDDSALDEQAQPSQPVSSQLEASEEAGESSSDSSDDDSPPDWSSFPEPPPMVPLPPSSGDINVPEEAVPHLFSVYNFLRSFSITLFLSPFGLDDFIGSLNCKVQNSLLDAVHLTVMRALRRHLELLSLNDNEMASKCLRHCDWTLLDALTWPAILLEYLFIMGYTKGLVEKGFNFGLSAGEYYRLPVNVKLQVLQILCDDVVDSPEIRSELDTRVGKEDGDENDALGSLDNSVQSKVSNPESKTLVRMDASPTGSDGNSDDCRLCGMQGSLVCCDGCPSAYHIRCLGLYKSFLPDGLWFCPECAVNKLGKSCSRIGRGAIGAEIFGIDAYGRMFLGTCNYLLVIGTSLSSDLVCTYYNEDDISKIITALCLTTETASVYADICRAISVYWEVPFVMQSVKLEPMMDTKIDKEFAMAHTSSSFTLPSGTADPLNGADGDHSRTTLAEGSSDNKAVVCQNDGSTEEQGNSSSLQLVDKVEFPDTEKHLATGQVVFTKEVPEVTDKIIHPVKDKQLASGLSPVTNTMILGKDKQLASGLSPVTNAMSLGKDKQLTSGLSSVTDTNAMILGKDKQLTSGLSSVTNTMILGKVSSESVVTDNTCYSNQTLAAAKRSAFLNTATCALGNGNGICKEDAHSSTSSTKMESLNMSIDSRTRFHSNDEKYTSKSKTKSSIRSVFKPQAYINLYVQGDLATSAASILAVQASEENKVSEAYTASNPKKVMGGKFALETKAFSRATTEFLWPSFDKLVEAPRAKCGWCSACSVSYKKGCLLNLAANISAKRFARNVSALRPNKPIDTYIPTVAAQIAHMLDSLHGLLVGPLLHLRYKEQWYKLMREASTCRALKSLLLELESNIRGISFSAEWTKLVDDLGEVSSDASSACRPGPGRKRGFGGRRKKEHIVAETENDSSGESPPETLQWWRGGRFSKVIFQKRALYGSLLKKLARQGGSKRVPGIHYPEVSGLPRRTRQFAWRASVQMSKNVSQLALQVRYLDAHIRWRDLVRAEENQSEGKVSDVDATAFRNAVICDKRIIEKKIMYALTFRIQKHLSLRVTKNILETEKTQDGEDKSWFSEYHVPLYLIKEYEEKVGTRSPPLNGLEMSRLHSLPQSKLRQKKGQGDIFTYLTWKRDAVRCNTCRAYCEKDCAVATPASKEGDLEIFTCTKCYRMKFASLVGNNKPNSSTHRPILGQNYQQSLKVQNQLLLQRPNQQTLVKRHDVSSQPYYKEVQSGTQCSTSEHKRVNITDYGLMWKRKKSDGPGRPDFRITNILFKKRDGINPLKGVTCSLCKKPYCADLMYVCCEVCCSWYHADAVQLEEARAFDLVGFKCNRCRRRRSPECPYKNCDYRKPGVELLTPINVERNEGMFKSQDLLHSTTSEFDFKVEDFDLDPLVNSLCKVEPIEEAPVDAEVHFEEPWCAPRSQQKLFVRRPQVKHETEPENLSTQVEWDSSQAWDFGDADFGTVDLENQSNDPEIGITEMEFEPQTYFSFTELLADDDDQIGGQYDMPTNTPMDLSHDNSGNTFQDVRPYGPSGACEMVVNDQFSVPNGRALEATACWKCKLNQPSPDLVCDICKMCVHSHCSPWENNGDTRWRCGSCREWQ